MTKLYKLTDQNSQTRNNTQWGPGVAHTTSGKGQLCSAGWLHAYTDPYLAVLLNPIHADISNPQLWKCEGEVKKTDNGLKVGCTSLTTVKQIKLPKISNEQKIKFAIYCALEVYSAPEFTTWATDWLNGKDRSQGAANAANAAGAAAYASSNAADAAAYAAYAAYASSNAADAAAYAAASAASNAAEAAAKPFSLIELAHKAMRP